MEAEFLPFYSTAVVKQSGKVEANAKVSVVNDSDVNQKTLINMAIHNPFCT